MYFYHCTVNIQFCHKPAGSVASYETNFTSQLNCVITHHVMHKAQKTFLPGMHVKDVAIKWWIHFFSITVR